MLSAHDDIIDKLRKELLVLGGMKSANRDSSQPPALPFMQGHLPNGHFPTAAVHEFLCPAPESRAATIGFVAGLHSMLFTSQAVIAWIAEDHSIFPPVLAAFNLKPHQLLCIRVSRLNDAIWVTEEALRCKGFNGVISTFNGLDFKQSRRYQLAVEQSGVTGFLLNTSSKPSASNACVGRWSVHPIPGRQVGALPGVGLPSWQVDLQKMRHGKPGSWEVCWSDGRLHQLPEKEEAVHQIHKLAV